MIRGDLEELIEVVLVLLLEGDPETVVVPRLVAVGRLPVPEIVMLAVEVREAADDLLIVGLLLELLLIEVDLVSVLEAVEDWLLRDE